MKKVKFHFRSDLITEQIAYKNMLFETQAICLSNFRIEVKTNYLINILWP